MISVKANSVSDTANAANSDAKEPGKKNVVLLLDSESHWLVPVVQDHQPENHLV